MPEPMPLRGKIGLVTAKKKKKIKTYCSKIFHFWMCYNEMTLLQIK